MIDGHLYTFIGRVNTSAEECEGVIQASPRRDSRRIPTITQHDFDFNGYTINVLEILSDDTATDVDMTTRTAQPVATHYYTVSGIERKRPGSGINIVVTTMSDGTRRVEKIINR